MKHQHASSLSLLQKFEALAALEERYKRTFLILEQKYKGFSQITFNDIKNTLVDFSNTSDIVSKLVDYKLIDYFNLPEDRRQNLYFIPEFKEIKLNSGTLNHLFSTGVSILSGLSLEQLFLIFAIKKFLYDKEGIQDWRNLISIINSEEDFDNFPEINDLLKNKIDNDKKDDLYLYFKCIGELLNSIKFDEINQNDLINAFENLYADTTLSENKQAFYTPPEVNELACRIFDIENNAIVLDPAGGTGALLATLKKCNPAKNLNFISQEYNEKISKLMEFNLNKLNTLNAEINTGDSLTEPKFKESKYVISNPPWNLKDYDGHKLNNQNYLKKFSISPYRNSADIAFIQLALHYATDKALLILDAPFLARGGKDSELREKLIKEGLIETIITIPKGVFYNTQVPGVIIIFNKNRKTEDKDKLFFINLASDDEKKDKEFSKPHPYRKNVIELRQDKLDDIAKTIKNLKKGQDLEDIAKVIKLKEIEKKGYNLNPNLYFTKELTTIDKHIELENLKSQINEINEKINFPSNDFKINKTGNIALGEIIDFIRGDNFKSSESVTPLNKDYIAVLKSIEGDLKYIPAGLKFKSEKTLRENDIITTIFSTNKDIFGKTLLISNDLLKNFGMEKSTISSTLAIIRITNDYYKQLITPEYLNFFLNSMKFKEQIQKSFTGSKASSLSKPTLENFEIPVPVSLEECERFIKKMKKIEYFKIKLTELINTVSNIKEAFIQDNLEI